MTKNIAYAINEGYADYCLASIVSVLENNRDSYVNFHILTDKLTDESRRKFKRYVEVRGGEVSFYEIPDSMVSDLILNDWGKHAWYRLFLPKLLREDVDRVLYLDTDTIVCGDISALFNIDLSDNSLAGCMDYMGFYDGIYERIGYPKRYGYICSGVILFNLDYFRKHDLSRKIMDFARENPEKINFPDQDAINAVCHASMKLLPLKYDMLAPFFTNRDFINTHEEEVRDMLRDPRIIHYAGCNPWKRESSKHYFYDEFWKYADMVGGIRPKRMITGFALVKHRIKQALGLLGGAQFRKFRPQPKPDFTTAKQLLAYERKTN